jgi:D-tyrosyl-tRNA(Tyr) deacylase
VRLVIQRVSRAAVRVDGREVAEIGPGLLILVGVGGDSVPEEVPRLAAKVASLRIFEDNAGKMNRSLLDAGVEALVVPQFTLYGDARRGRRPSWAGAAPPDVAAEFVERFARELEAAGARVQRGAFQEHMEVELINDGPVTMLLEGQPKMELRQRFAWE